MARTTMAPRNPPLLRAVMFAAGLNGALLADAAGITKQFASLILCGRRRCNTAVAAAISAALGQPMEALFTMTSMSDDSHNTGQEDTVPPNTTLIENDDPYLSFDQVAALVNIPPKTLRSLRATKQGPPFHKRGQILAIRKSKALAWYRETYEDVDEGADA